MPQLNPTSRKPIEARGHKVKTLNWSRLRHQESEHDNILLLTPRSNIPFQDNIFQHPFCDFLEICKRCRAQIFYIVGMGNPSIFYHKYESRNFKKYLFLCHNMLAVQLTLLLLAFFIPEVNPPEKVCIHVPSRY